MSPCRRGISNIDQRHSSALEHTVATTDNPDEAFYKIAKDLDCEIEHTAKLQSRLKEEQESGGCSSSRSASLLPRSRPWRSWRASSRSRSRESSKKLVP